MTVTVRDKLREFLNTKQGIACTIAAAVVVLAALVFGGYEIWYNTQDLFHDVTIELGTESVDITDFMNNKSRASDVRFVTDVSKVNIGRVGDTKITLALGDKEETVTLRVEDTTPPDVEFVDRLVKTLSYQPNAEDFVENVEDYSATTVQFAEEPDRIKSYEEVPVTIIVADSSGNVTEKECTLCYRWILEEYTIELGEELTAEELLVDVGESKELINQEEIDAINSAGAGEYTIVSDYQNMRETCLVRVVDTIAPELELTSVSVYVGREVDLDSFVTYVNDASHEVELRLASDLPYDTAGKYTVTIEAEDPSGNVTVKSTVLSVTGSYNPPVFSGLTTLTVYIGSGAPNYTAGVSATSSSGVSCRFTYNDSGVNYNVAGTYYVVYTATDSSGNTTTANRRVIVTSGADNNDTTPSVSTEPSASPSESTEPETSPSESTEPEVSPSVSTEPETSPSVSTEPSPSVSTEPEPVPSVSTEPEPVPSVSTEPAPAGDTNGGNETG